MSNILSNTNIIKDLEEKIYFMKDIIKESFSTMQNYKIMDIISGNELNTTINGFEKLSDNLNELNKKLISCMNIDCENIYNELKIIKSKLLSLFSNTGTKYFDKLITLLLDNNNIENIDNDKYHLLSSYAHPISYRILDWKNYNPSIKNKKYIPKNKIIDDKFIIEHASNLECFDASRTNKTFQIQVYGIKVIVHNYKKKETYVISCLIDDILLSCIDNYFILDKYSKLDSEKPKDNTYKNDDWENFKKFLTLKDFITLNNDEIYSKYTSILTQNNFYKQKNISQIVNEFLNSDLYIQRNILINLLVKSNDNEYQYLAYLLYDILSNDNQTSIDTIEQTMLYDSLPWNCKIYFKNAMKQTISYTNQLCNYDETKIPLEQQICLMKANNIIKEKAMVKLKEIKAKSEDSGSKARHYLDGLLKIPFGIYREEHVLSIKKQLNTQFISLLDMSIIKNIEKFAVIKKNIYTIIEIKKIIQIINNNILPEILNNMRNEYINNIKNLKKPDIVKINININNFISNNNYQYDNLSISNKKIDFLTNNINNFVNSLTEKEYLINYFKTLPNYENECNNIEFIEKNILEITDKINTISQYMKQVKENLDTSVYGHDNAKEQIETIIAQWINGEKAGYCFGFEGPPGIGKTSLAKKGISKCLQDQDGNSRPFSFIAIGGSSNGSTLEGHNYTYVGSTWGKIVDVLMENKCMNPIIFIDELDKISKTEHGREIIGILTHIVDYTQNDSFQDKYFNGVDLDLSKVLFIFSYNDVDAIDKILLDRIHRIKFKHLSLEEKITITKNFILPEIYKKVGFENVVSFNDNVLINIINNYTCEPGVRKLKEILFEIVGKINLNLLNNNFDDNLTLPINITYESIKNDYLKNRHELNVKNIISKPEYGIINGLWANSLGQGGLLYIEVKKIISSTLLELKLTGMQGDVMKESMNVAKTVAIEKYTKTHKIDKIVEEYKNIGLHIHAPEGATPKDGPSAGAAITTAIYSILTKKKINNLFALTGEISLQGCITEIGGLDLKILGGIKSGAKKFIYPKSNEKDFNDFYEKYRGKEILKDIEFYSVENIDQVFKLILID